MVASNWILGRQDNRKAWMQCFCSMEESFTVSVYQPWWGHNPDYRYTGPVSPHKPANKRVLYRVRVTPKRPRRVTI